MRHNITFGLALAIGLTVNLVQAADYSPHVALQPPRALLWGDTHLHSSLSTDAFGFGVTLGPEAAYRFASGETVTSTHGEPARLARPLDFVVLADHAESFGLMNRVQEGDKRLIANDKAAQWHRVLTQGTPEEKRALQRKFLTREGRWEAFGLLDRISTPDLELDVWGDAVAIAERYNRPGVFTTLLGYEWTSAPGGSNLHRVVIFRDGSDRAGRIPPLSSQADPDPRSLWAHLEQYERKTGGKALAIPHNGNLSNGLMFPVAERLDGLEVDAEYAAQRARWEPVVEVTQIKGDGETHPLLSPDDEFADYETWDLGNFEGKPKTPEMLPREYARAALRSGLNLQRSLGTNPYQFGMIGATDSHTGLATADEDNFFGKHSAVEPGPQRWQHAVGRAGDTVVRGWQMAASGYAAVWAHENNREAIWDAIKRREVYATTGSRIAVRFFGGWGFEPGDAQRPDIAAVGYAGGVPMGGELVPAGGGSPVFLVAASRDPLGANLDRIQIVKGWLDDRGETHEQVYDVVWSDGREASADGKLPEVGSTVDETAATWLNTIGEASLATVWRDPDFDPQQEAFYYARVLEIPTPRWTAYDRQRYALGMDAAVPLSTQERAYTSPIWYRAASGE
ncbi:DUF3604 domain-containing protein [Pseudohalioglobus lutimaris]|uniref:DUF3604 domain-containing protein n=1 Tax=Pseudohalioglobus lutimaris TaxID=1737061 RepID=A0A2N5X5T3_9GAMM|nr:DUF3604 domain-containing protein [Pseudohalioglobus lutimaris]PLW69844.1 DUF3604 domain-containing protein [Pseudohalioglobus lutimaris]